MFSVTSTGMCWRPLCTAIVSPTMSGMTIERRDQVLIGLRSFLADATCTFFARCRSTNGPFFSERGIYLGSRAAHALRATFLPVRGRTGNMLHKNQVHHRILF